MKAGNVWNEVQWNVFTILIRGIRLQPFQFRCTAHGDAYGNRVALRWLMESGENIIGM